MKVIVGKDDPVLRKKATEVSIKDIGQPKINKVLKDMKETLASQGDGVAIAAPQIGVSLRIFVVSGKVIDYIKSSENETSGEGGPRSADVVFINPKIVKLSKTKKAVEEGCLSIRYIYGKIERSQKAKIRALNENGKVFEIGASGLLAQILQHENDHLDGILFTDNAKDLQNLPPLKLKQNDL